MDSWGWFACATADRMDFTGFLFHTAALWAMQHTIQEGKELISVMQAAHKEVTS